MTQISLPSKVSARSDSFCIYFAGNSIRSNRFHEIGETEETPGPWWLRGEASRRQGRGGWMQIPEFLCRPWRSGYLAVQRIKVAVFTIGNADRAAIVLPYKRPPGYRRTGLSSLNTTIVVHFFATRITNVHRVTIRYFVSIACTSWKRSPHSQSSFFFPLHIVPRVFPFTCHGIFFKSIFMPGNLNIQFGYRERTVG